MPQLGISGWVLGQHLVYPELNLSTVCIFIILITTLTTMTIVIIITTFVLSGPGQLRSVQRELDKTLWAAEKTTTCFRKIKSAHRAAHPLLALGQPCPQQLGSRCLWAHTRTHTVWVTPGSMVAVITDCNLHTFISNATQLKHFNRYLHLQVFLHIYSVDVWQSKGGKKARWPHLHSQTYKQSATVCHSPERCRGRTRFPFTLLRLIRLLYDENSYSVQGTESPKTKTLFFNWE